MKKTGIILASLAALTLGACSSTVKKYEIPSDAISVTSLGTFSGPTRYVLTEPSCKIVKNEKILELNPDKECSTTIEDVVERQVRNNKGKLVKVKATIKTTHTYRLEFSRGLDKYLLVSPTHINGALCEQKFKEGTKQIYHRCDMSTVKKAGAKYPGFLTVNVNLQRMRSHEAPLRIYVAPNNASNESNIKRFVDAVEDKVKDRLEDFAKEKAEELYYQWGGNRLFGELVKFFVNKDKFDRKTKQECEVEAEKDFDKWLNRQGLNRLEDKANYERQRDIFLDICYRENNLGKYAITKEDKEGQESKQGPSDKTKTAQEKGGAKNAFKGAAKGLLKILKKYKVRAGPNFISGTFYDVVRPNDNLRVRIKGRMNKGFSVDPQLKSVDFSYRWFGDGHQYAWANLSVSGLNKSEKRVTFSATFREHWVSCIADKVGYPIEYLFNRGLQGKAPAYSRCGKKYN